MKKIGFLTLGCRVNQYESDAIKERLEALGHEVCELCRAVIYILSTPARLPLKVMPSAARR